MPKRALLYVKIITLMLAFTILPISIGTTSAYFTDSETVQIAVSAGTWENKVSISKVCPDWGVTGTCRWGVFIYGKGFKRNCKVRLIKGDQTLPAVKNWVISDSLLLAIFDLRGAQTGNYDTEVILADGSKGVLRRGFQVIDNYFGCPFSFQRYCDSDNQLSIEKEFDPQDPNLLLITPVGGCPGKPDKAYLVGSAQFINGRISKGKGRTGLAFELPAKPLLRYDLVLQYGEISLFFEGAVTLFNLDAHPRINSIDPSSALAGKTADINIYGENLSEKTELWLECGDTRMRAISTRAIDGTHLICTFDLKEAAEGTYSLKATDNNGISVCLRDCFLISRSKQQEDSNSEDSKTREDPDTKVSILPSKGTAGSTVSITIDGRSFTPGIQARLSGKHAFSLSIECQVTSSGLRCTFNLVGISAGPYKLEILDNAGNIVCCAGDFEVI